MTKFDSDSTRAWSRRRSRSRLAVASVGLLMLLVTACSSTTKASSQTGGTPTSASANSLPADPSAAVAAAFKGLVTTPPPSAGPKPAKGKTVWVLNCVAYSACKIKGDAFSAAAKVLGWNVKTLDDKADPTTGLTEINEAIAAHASAIVIIPFDCPLIKSGLQAARAAHIPVLDYGGLDCNAESFGGGESLFSAPVKVMGTVDGNELFGLFGKEDADFMAAELQSMGATHAKIVSIQNLDQVIHATMSNAFATELKQKCPGCTVVPEDFTVSQTNSGQGFEIFKSALLANPGADAIYFQIGSLIQQGLEEAINTSGQHYKLICCGDGSGPDIAFANASNTADEIAVHVQPAAYIGWALADELNRIFAGETAAQIPSEGGYELYVDKSHPLGNPPIDYVAAYTKAWTG